MMNIECYEVKEVGVNNMKANDFTIGNFYIKE